MATKNKKKKYSVDDLKFYLDIYKMNIQNLCDIEQEQSSYYSRGVSVPDNRLQKAKQSAEETKQKLIEIYLDI